MEDRTCPVLGNAAKTISRRRLYTWAYLLQTPNMAFPAASGHGGRCLSRTTHNDTAAEVSYQYNRPHESSGLPPAEPQYD